MQRLKRRFACGLVLAAQLALVLSARAQQPIVFHGVPSNATVNCLSDLPAGLLTALDAVPYGVPTNALPAVGDTFYLQPWGLQGIGGKWGPLDSCGILYGAANTIEAIVNGCEISVGQIVEVATGFLGVKEGFQQRYDSGNRIIVLPVTSLYPDGNHDITILGLFVGEMLDAGTGAGLNWHLQVKLLSAPSSFPNVTATSTCTGAVNVAFNETRSNSTSSCNTVILRTWTATDLCGNSLSTTQTITVSNTLPLSISCPSNMTVAADAGQCTASHVNLGVAIAIDNCSVAQAGTSNAPDAFPVGINHVIWTAGCAACTQTVVVVDTQPPVLTCPSNVLTNTMDPTGAIITFSVGATDNCDPNVIVNSTPASGSKFGVGTTPVYCVATDCAGNAITNAFNVSVVDGTIFGITSIAPQSNDVLLTWTMPLGLTGFVQAAAGDVDGNFSNAFGDVGAPIFLPGTGTITTNCLDAGVLTNTPSRFYRVRLVP